MAKPTANVSNKQQSSAVASRKAYGAKGYGELGAPGRKNARRAKVAQAKLGQGQYTAPSTDS